MARRRSDRTMDCFRIVGSRASISQGHRISTNSDALVLIGKRRVEAAAYCKGGCRCLVYISRVAYFQRKIGQSQRIRDLRDYWSFAQEARDTERLHRAHSVEYGNDAIVWKLPDFVFQSDQATKMLD